MTQELVVLDSQVFDLLIELPPKALATIRERYLLATTDVNLIELGRIPSPEKRAKILSLARSCEILGAKILGMPSYSDEMREDSLGGLAQYDDPSAGVRFLRYEDADILNAIGIEQNKLTKGTSQNDAAIALAIFHSKATGIIGDKKLRNRLKRLGARVLSFDEFLAESASRHKDCPPPP